MELKHNVVGWFEIPVTKMDRAIKFYETVFGFKFQREKFGPVDMAMFPGVENTIGTGGALAQESEMYQPRDNGVLIYFTAFSGDVAVELGRVQNAGGKVLLPKTLITKEIGYMGIFLDPEGNRIGIHSHK